MGKHVNLSVTIAGRKEERVIPVTLSGNIALVGIQAATMRAINEQHPDETGRPIVSIKYNVRENR